MNKEQFAELLNGREYREEMSKKEQELAKQHGLVIVFGASDDLIEFRGAIYDEAGAYDEGEIFFTKDGKFPDDEAIEIVREWVPDFKLNKIEYFWDLPNEPTWTYTTNIPHSTFLIMEDETEYCRGLVFNKSDLL